MQNWWLEKLNKIRASVETLEIFTPADDNEDGDYLYE